MSKITAQRKKLELQLKDLTVVTGIVCLTTPKAMQLKVNNKLVWIPRSQIMGKEGGERCVSLWLTKWAKRKFVDQSIESNEALAPREKKHKELDDRLQYLLDKEGA
jgi:hypothetical protein